MKQNHKYQCNTHHTRNTHQRRTARKGPGDEDERDAMQLWFEARWARLVAQRRARDEARGDPASRRVARLQRRLSRPLSGKSLELYQRRAHE